MLKSSTPRVQSFFPSFGPYFTFQVPAWERMLNPKTFQFNKMTNENNRNEMNENEGTWQKDFGLHRKRMVGSKLVFPRVNWFKIITMITVLYKIAQTSKFTKLVPSLCGRLCGCRLTIAFKHLAFELILGDKLLNGFQFSISLFFGTYLKP